MNFNNARLNKGKVDAKGYAVKTDAFLTFTEINGVTLTQNQKQTVKTKASDDAGESHTVNFYGNILPAANMIGKRVVASVAVKDGQYGETWQGFLKSGNVAQPSQMPQQILQNAQQGGLTPPQATNGNGKPDWDAISAGKVRHGVVCAAIESGQMICKSFEDVLVYQDFIVTGKVPLTAAPEPDDLPPDFMQGVKNEVPFDQQYNLGT